jgi:hypothetical protein
MTTHLSGAFRVGFVDQDVFGVEADAAGLVVQGDIRISDGRTGTG